MFERKHWILFFLVIVLLLMILAVPVGGRKAQISAPAEKTFSGTVEAVNQHTCEICKCVEIRSCGCASLRTPDHHTHRSALGHRLPRLPRLSHGCLELADSIPALVIALVGCLDSVPVSAWTVARVIPLPRRQIAPQFHLGIEFHDSAVSPEEAAGSPQEAAAVPRTFR
jgi:hypothetical protein